MREKDKKTSFAREALGIGILCLGIFLFFSIYSYNHLDPSLFSHSKRIPLNYGGRLGAHSADALIQFLGYPSFIVSALFMILGLRLLFSPIHLNRFFILKYVFGSALILLSSFAFLSLHVAPISFGGSAVNTGGLFGQWLGDFLTHYLNLWGTTLLCLGVFSISTLLIFPPALFKVLRFCIGALILMITHSLSGLVFLMKSLAHFALSYKEQLRTKSLLNESKIFASGNPTKYEEKQIRSEYPENLLLERTKNENAPASNPSDTVVQLRPLLDLHSNLSPTRPVYASTTNPPEVPKKTVLQGDFSLPPLGYLNAPEKMKTDWDKEQILENSKILETKLSDFGIEGQVVAVRPGPVITLYEFKPGPGVKISQIANLADDLSLALAAQTVRIVAPIPGKNVVGIEIPNAEREKVFLREILETIEFQSNRYEIPLAVGKDIYGTPFTTDLARMPHLLIAGAPGAGKSVFINSFICSLLYKFTPKDLRLIMVDPKQLELNLYENIPHLLLPVVDDPKKASTALKWAVVEMEKRYKLMAKTGVRNIAGFNQKLSQEGKQKILELLCPEDSSSLAHLLETTPDGQSKLENLPFILVIIDEFADLMMVAPKDIEISVARLAQKARAAGIHLVIATQRPSVDVITGLIKANLPSRVSFQVASKVDSRTILDGNGAEKLLGRGDMLFIPPGLSRVIRLHGAYVDEKEIGRICDHWKAQGAPEYKEEILIEPEESNLDLPDGIEDELYSQAVSIVRDLGQASASMLQRRLKIGYNRAARMVESMEAQGVVGPADGSRPREVMY